ncbi:MAG TPA: PQQ-dependent catabolism-associated CXXCW motif protein [Rhodopila sp.]|jgi:PQQ-dependent catabolism-associated CXXCW motif protein|nr:PQQ-dependent catabolism-associated CXXCW motif protein [Rhodopila sp.]
MTTALRLVVLAVATLLSLPVRSETAPLEPAGYRLGDYRSPVPATMEGKPALTTAQAAALWRDHAAIFIDTLPQPPRPAGLPAATIWHPKPRDDIPGSIWLPDTGYGALAPVMQRYFADNLQAATQGDRQRRLVFYCLANCWMSWNAAKRAVSLGYTQVDWYPDGSDGWAAQNLPLEQRDPVPRPAE